MTIDSMIKKYQQLPNREVMPLSNKPMALLRPFFCGIWLYDILSHGKSSRGKLFRGISFKIFAVIYVTSLNLTLVSFSHHASAQNQPEDIISDISCPRHDYSINQWGNRKKSFNFPSNIGVEPNSVQITCVQLYGMKANEIHTIQLQREEYEYRINDGKWQPHSAVNIFRNEDKLYLRTTTERGKGEQGQTYVLIDDDYASLWNYQTENTPRSPKTWQVGPNRSDQQLSDIQSQLVAGDTVELDGNATYHAVEFTRSGLSTAPITIRGIAIEGKRPVISGNISEEKKWALSFANSHFYEVDNIEVTAGEHICVRNMAHQVTITNTYIHDCPGQGILGTDQNSGTLILNHVEVAHSGHGTYDHAIYVATDGHQFPNSKLRIEHSYIHDFRGNGIKSRAYRTEFLANWVQQSEWVNPDDNSDHSYYSLELIGPDGYEPDEPLEQVVLNNVFEHKKLSNGDAYGMRFGGDGTGYSWGKVLFSSNIVISPPKDQTSIIKTQFRMGSVYMNNNLFIRADSLSERWGGLRLFSNTADAWYYGETLIFGVNNWYPYKTVVEKASQIPKSALTQWKEGNMISASQVSGIYFDSVSGVIQIPEGNSILSGSPDYRSADAQHYLSSDLSEGSEREFERILIRPQASPR